MTIEGLFSGLLKKVDDLGDKIVSAVNKFKETPSYREHCGPVPGGGTRVMYIPSDPAGVIEEPTGWGGYVILREFKVSFGAVKAVISHGDGRIEVVNLDRIRYFNPVDADTLVPEVDLWHYNVPEHQSMLKAHAERLDREETQRFIDEEDAAEEARYNAEN